MTRFAHHPWLALVVLLCITVSTRAQDGGAAAPEEDVRTFVAEYEAAVNDRDVARINAAVDVAKLIGRARDGLSVPPALLKGFAEGVRQGLDWGRSMAHGVGRTGHYRLLGFRRADGQPRALLRLVNDQGGLNYHEVMIERGDEGRPMIVDVHVYLSGERLSETLRRSLRQILAATQGGDRAYLEAVGLLESMTAQARDGEYVDALATYERMPAVMQHDKTVLIVRLTCAAEAGREDLDRACREFRALYPDDPCVDLLTIDHLIVEERWAEAIAAFRRIDQLVGGDAYVDDLIANIHLRRGDLDQARALARRSIDRDPDLDAGYWTLLEIAIRRRDHEATARLLSTLEDAYGWRFDDIASVGTYADFVASPAYAQWMRSRRAADDSAPG